MANYKCKTDPSWLIKARKIYKVVGEKLVISKYEVATDGDFRKGYITYGVDEFDKTFEKI